MVQTPKIIHQRKTNKIKIVVNLWIDGVTQGKYPGVNKV